MQETLNEHIGVRFVVGVLDGFLQVVLVGDVVLIYVLVVLQIYLGAGRSMEGLLGFDFIHLVEKQLVTPIQLRRFVGGLDIHVSSAVSSFLLEISLGSHLGYVLYSLVESLFV